MPSIPHVAKQASFLRKDGLILQKSDAGFEAHGVLNPAVIWNDGTLHMLYRAVNRENRSSIGYARLNAPLLVGYRAPGPVLEASGPEESHGIEDPRVVQIEGTFFLTYTAYDGQNALGALATSTDLEKFEKHGIIAPRITNKEFSATVRDQKVHKKYLRLDQSSYLMWDKNLMFFPRKIGGKFALLHRIRPGIQIAFLDDPTQTAPRYWDAYFRSFESHIVLDPRYEHEMSYIGGGCPPIETAAGWLLIYHAVHDTMDGYVYSACAALLDLDDPRREIGRLPYPLFSPDQDYEAQGEVNNVCFPTGAIVQDGRLYIYYGAADDKIACASLELNDLLDELTATRTK